MVYEPFTAKTAAAAIRRELDAGDEEFAFKVLVRAITEFRRTISSGQQEEIARFLDPPESTGSIRWDTLLAATIGRECRLAGIDSGQWTRPDPLSSFWFVYPSPELMARTMERTSPDLGRLGIWIDQNSFETR